ncbi:MAG: VCBS repeat-containing protein, partial [Verrucomicrobiota bacterium]
AGEAACATQFSTGAALADLDGDGDLDLLVNGIAAGTRLFLNDGKGGLTEARDTGLSRTASATSLALADLDRDGDLDLYCTHFIDLMMLSDPTTRFAVMRKGDAWEVTKVNGESTRSPRWQGRFEALADGRVRELPEVHGLYRNEGGGRFRAIESESGTFQDERGRPIPPFRDWGLAAMFRDLNGDGYPDLYVCNDNTSPDRIWINTGRGTFRALETTKLRHTSRSSMGVDFCDLDRDGHDDFFVVDMLGRDPARRKRQLMRDRPDPAELESVEARPQFNRNTLFFGRADGSFVEAALLAGVAATDWTWSSLLLDVDLDGYEDLLVTNGFEFDVMDQDSQNEIKLGRRKYSEAQLKRSLQFHPTWRTRNAAFRNRRDGTFEPAPQWGFDDAGVSFGAALADLDQDGDLDLVVNNLNAPAGLYRNDATAPRVRVRLRGHPPNTHGIGARVELAGGPVTQAQEILAGGRYLSGEPPERVFAAQTLPGSPLSLRVRWPDGARTILSNVEPNRVYEILPPANPAAAPDVPPPAPPPLLENVSAWLAHEHQDAAFDDWARQPLLPKRLSRLGPGVAWQDFDGDGWEDLAVAGGRGGRLALFRNREGRTFEARAGAVLAGDQGAVVGWPDGQGARKLLAAGSAHELPPGGRATLEIHHPAPGTPPETLDLGEINPGPLTLGDADGDGDLDVLVGGRFRTGQYPEPVPSTLWKNEAGRLVPDSARSVALQKLGMVAGATWADLDGDGQPEWVVALEWGAIRVFRRQGASLEEVTRAWGLEPLTGWWTGVTAGDF